MEHTMKKSSDNSEQDKTGRCFEDNPWPRLIPSIFEDTEAQLHSASKRLTKLLHFVGGVLGDDFDEYRQSKEYLGLRQWYLARLKRLNRELYRQIEDMFKTKLAVANVIERLTKAKLEKSVEDDMYEDDSIENDGHQDDDLHKTGKLHLAFVRPDNEPNAPDEK
jgi:hypothetical protein